MNRAPFINPDLDFFESKVRAVGFAAVIAACHPDFFGIGESSSVATQTQNSATDEGRVLSGKGNIFTSPNAVTLTGKGNKYISPGATELGANAKLYEPGSFSLGNLAAGATVNSSVQFGAGDDVIQHLSDNLAGSSDQLANLLTQQAAQIGTLAESVQSDGETLWKKPFTWIAIVVLVVMALFVWRKT